MYRIGVLIPHNVYCLCIVVYIQCSVTYSKMYSDMLATQCSETITIHAVPVAERHSAAHPARVQSRVSHLTIPRKN